MAQEKEEGTYHLNEKCLDSSGISGKCGKGASLLNS